MKTPAQIISREQRFALPVAIASVLAVIFVFVIPTLLINSVVSGEGDADFLRSVDGDNGTFMAALIARAVGYLLLLAPLLYLFRAAADRSAAVRGQLIGVIYAAPIFLAISSVLVAIATVDASSQFVAESASLTGDAANDAARDLINEGSLRGIAGGFGLAGQLGFAVGMAYSCFQAMKIGLLTRFWGSLGAALGAISFLFPVFTLFWFIYFGIMVAGWVPGGRPPAWAEGRAIAWPKPGEELDDDEDEDNDPDGAGPDLNGQPALDAADQDGETGDGSSAPAPSRATPVRKRKRRS